VDQKPVVGFTGKITASPNPLLPEAGTGLRLRWETNSDAAEVWVKEDDTPEKLVSRSQNHSASIDWIRPDRTYIFRLYHASPRLFLDEVSVRQRPVGTITAYPNPVPLESGCRTTLQWKITPPAVAELYVSQGDSEEKLVCCGTSGSQEFSQLRPGVEFRFRLYARGQLDRLLDEVTVTLAPLPWHALLERLRSMEKDHYPQEVAHLIAAIVSACLHRDDFDTWFRLWEENGFHVTPVHFYQPIPDLRTLSQRDWERPFELVGIDLNERSQVDLLSNVFPQFHGEYRQFPAKSSDQRPTFSRCNGHFEGLDSAIAYCMVRHFRPRRIIEVGSGFSTLLLAAAAQTNGGATLVSIDPYPKEFLLHGIPGLTSLMQKKVEEIDLAYFDQLETGDFFFIDTSHVVRTGGDVNYLFLEILPRLKPGVIVHVHDIFFPIDYPRKYVIDRRRFWTEQYLLQAFLIFNSQFEVLVSSEYLMFHHADTVRAVFPDSSPWQAGSFWMRRKPALALDTPQKVE